MAVAAVFAASVLPGAVFGQSVPNEPIKTTLCELASAPERFNGRIVAVRGPIQIAFENFTFSLSECESRKVDDVWLEYGRGPKQQPTTWCCGDMVPRDTLILVQDKEFRRFHRYLTDEKKERDCYNCYGFKVTATLTGRFEAVDTQPCPGDGKGHCCEFGGGFGHFGASCARLVIQRVTGVVAKQVDR
ncbi:MAG TPA: hypothetical protein VG456_24655 [Candidatus Sulfopaludibacter sp.]|nr:hypothetical protein [Candidatus Sulfopaludibacter sp.]